MQTQPIPTPAIQPPEAALVSHRGQITLPTKLRKRYGIEGGGFVMMEARDGEIVLKPAAVMEISLYSDDQIAAWDADDALAPGERDALARAAQAQPR